MTKARQPFETLEAGSTKTVRQLSVFLDNRVGQLLRLTKLFDSEHIRVMALAVIDSADYAVSRMLFDRPDQAAEVLREAGVAFSVAEVLVVQLPPDARGLLPVFASLLSAEINVSYAYPLLPSGKAAALALAMDNLETGAEILQRKNFTLLGEADLQAWA